MARAGNLDARTVEAAQKRDRPYRLSDGGGLLLEVKPTGAKVWLCRLTVAGKRRDMGLGGYPLVSLKEARRKAAEARGMAQEKLDPIAERAKRQRALEEARKAEEEASRRTFRAVATAFISGRAASWKNNRTALIWQSSLERLAFPTLGDMPVAAIERADVLRVIEPVWAARPETGRKLLQRIGVVLTYAFGRGWRAGDNPATARVLKRMELLTNLPAGRKFPHLPWGRVPAFLAALDEVQGLGAIALRMVVLTALRSGEVRHARWSWLSFDGVPTLTVPAANMKRDKTKEALPHRVPLSDAALETLARAYGYVTGEAVTVAQLPRLAALAGDRLIFPSSTMRTPLSDATLSAVMKRMNSDGPEGMPPPWRDADGRAAVPHGFRASFSTWVDDTRPEDRAAAEKALAHEVANKVSGAYRRSDLFDRRAPLMQAWAAHCCGTTKMQARHAIAAGA